MFDSLFFIKTFFLLWTAVPTTLLISLVSLLLGSLLGLGIALSRIYSIRILKQLSVFYVSFIRGTPIVLQILVAYSILPSFLNALIKARGLDFNIFEVNPIIYAFIVFSLNMAAGLSEVFRSALSTVDKGQLEAGYTSGLSAFQTYRRIILPQALVAALPNLSTASVNLIKNTSLAFMMTVKDVTAMAKIQASYGYNYLESYLDIFLIYLILCSLVQALYKKWEKNWSRYKRRKNYA